MPIATQLTVTLANRPGTLARVARVLGDAGVNILAFQASTSGRAGEARFIVNNANKAKKALGRAGYSCKEEPVLHVQLPNRAGVLADMAGKLAAKRININWGYATTLKGQKKATVVFSVSNLKKAARVR